MVESHGHDVPVPSTLRITGVEIPHHPEASIWLGEPRPGRSLPDVVADES